MENQTAPRATLAALNTRLVDWLAGDAYPVWSTRGIDPRRGGFVESIGQNGVALPEPRRARVQPRQVYAFAQAPLFHWRGDAARIVRDGIDYFTAHYRREDGLYRTLADADGAVLDERALLYDQSFALLGYAAAALALDARKEFERRALGLRHRIESHLAAADGAFLSSDSAGDCHRESNPHMHLLEACLAWAETGNDPGWISWAMSLVDLALSRFINPATGALGEVFTDSWQAAAGQRGHVIEPGHQYEWAWLLLRCERRHPAPLRKTAQRMIGNAERFGVRGGVAVNALLDDFAVEDPAARLWPQTERLKAALLAATLTGDAQYWTMAQAAAQSLLPYLDTPIAGLWRDTLLTSGEFVDAPAPASTFYHLVAAVTALGDALSREANAQ